jgi:hypothetical protein
MPASFVLQNIPNTHCNIQDQMSYIFMVSDGWKLRTCPQLTNTMSRVLSDKLTVAQLVKKLFSFYDIQTFNTVFTRTCHEALCWATWMQSTPYFSTIYLDIIHSFPITILCVLISSMLVVTCCPASSTGLLSACHLSFQIQPPKRRTYFVQLTRSKDSSPMALTRKQTNAHSDRHLLNRVTAKSKIVHDAGTVHISLRSHSSFLTYILKWPSVPHFSNLSLLKRFLTFTLNYESVCKRFRAES